MDMSKLTIVGMMTLSLLFIQTQASFEKEFLNEHNRYRAKHGCPKLKLDTSLSADCQSYAEKIAALDKLDHSESNPAYGENLCYVQSDPVSCVKMWYDEVKDYSYDKSKYSSETGHFTQLVWKASKKLGVGKKESASKKIYVVARYSPAGNVEGGFKTNVPRPSKPNGSISYKSFFSKYFALFLCIFPAMFAKIN